MKISKIALALSISMLSIQIYADSVQDEYKDLIAQQPSYEKFQKNYNDILGKIEEMTELGHQTQDRRLVYPMCVGIQSSITVLKNNQKYKAQYDRDYKQFNTSFDEALTQATEGIASNKTICDEAQKEYFK